VDSKRHVAKPWRALCGGKHEALLQLQLPYSALKDSRAPKVVALAQP